MSRKTHSINVGVDADQHEQLKALSERTRVPMAELVRQTIAAMLRAERHALWQRSEDVGERHIK